MADILLSDNGDGADIVLYDPIRFDGLIPETDNADFYAETGIGNAVYISLFGEPGWQEALKTSDERITDYGSLPELLNEPVTIGTISRVQTTAEGLLQWLVSDQVASSVTVEASNPRLGVLELDITVVEPEDVRNRFKVLWDQQEQKLISDFRSRPSVVEETL